jgi:hypothetical protein
MLRRPRGMLVMAQAANVICGHVDVVLVLAMTP